MVIIALLFMLFDAVGSRAAKNSKVWPIVPAELVYSEVKNKTSATQGTRAPSKISGQYVLVRHYRYTVDGKTYTRPFKRDFPKSNLAGLEAFLKKHPNGSKAEVQYMPGTPSFGHIYTGVREHGGTPNTIGRYLLLFSIIWFVGLRPRSSNLINTHGEVSNSD